MLDSQISQIKTKSNSWWRNISKLAKPLKFPRDIHKFFIIGKIVKESDLDCRESTLSVVIDPRLAFERNHATQYYEKGFLVELINQKV